MADNKITLTDAEIKKALEEWGKEIKDDYKRLILLDAPMDCFEESHTEKFLVLSNALDLINRLEADKEALIAGQETLQKLLDDKCDRCKTEAVKSLMFKLDNEISTYNSAGYSLDIYAWLKNYVKEMVGE